MTATTKTDLGVGLAKLAMEQAINYHMVHGHHVKASPDDVRTVALAINAEAIEVADELGWKPWKTPNAIDVERVLDEFADLTAFFGTMACYVMYRCNVGAQELADAYERKTAVNRQRFAGNVEGYGGSAVQNNRSAVAAMGHRYVMPDGFVGELVGYSGDNGPDNYIIRGNTESRHYPRGTFLVEVIGLKVPEWVASLVPGHNEG